MSEIKLGDRVKDVYTGLHGIATARYLFLYGCSRICVEPTELKDGKPVESSTFDEQRVEIVEPGQRVAPQDVPRIKLGDKVKDRMTGFAGVATARYTYLHNTPRIYVESSELKDGKPIDGHGFEEERLELVETKPIENHAPHVPSGGPQPSESKARRQDPK